MFDHQQSHSAVGIRNRINQVSKNDGSENSPGYQEIPSHARFTKHLGGMTTSWATFYQDINLDGLQLECQFPIFKLEALDMEILPGMKLPIEDCIITFQLNKNELGSLIMSDSGYLTDEILNQEKMCAGELFARGK